jgi:hypothetical protein
MPVAESGATGMATAGSGECGAAVRARMGFRGMVAAGLEGGPPRRTRGEDAGRAGQQCEQEGSEKKGCGGEL